MTVIYLYDINTLGQSTYIDSGLVTAFCQFSDFLAHCVEYLNIIKCISA